MSELTLLLLHAAFLVLLWFFVFGVVYSLRADLFGVRVRKLPEADVPRPAKQSSPQRPPAPSSASRIVITSGPKAGLEVPLGAAPITIGRSSEAGLVIRDDYTSSQHARLSPSGQNWTLEDLDSTNGTFHDGERVTSAVTVRIGAPIKIGATTFELRK